MYCRKKMILLLVLEILALAILMLGGCDDNNVTRGLLPAVLVGTWKEHGYDRQMILEADGDFQYVSMTAATAGNIEGSGTWDATDSNLTLHLISGHFRWLESMNNAPISFTFHYKVTNRTLTLTFEIMGQVSTTQYTKMD
jgi:hypothetical protein